jgi:hypothetical protein
VKARTVFVVPLSLCVCVSVCSQQLLIDKEAKSGGCRIPVSVPVSVPVAASKGAARPGGGAQPSPGHLLLHRVVTQRLCQVDVVLEVAQAAVVGWGLAALSVSQPGEEGEEESSATLGGGGGRGGRGGEMFCCPELECLAAAAWRRQDGRMLLDELLRRLHLLKSAPSQPSAGAGAGGGSAGGGFRLPVMALLLAVACFVQTSGSAAEVKGVVWAPLLRYLLAPPALRSFQHSLLPLLPQGQYQEDQGGGRGEQQVGRLLAGISSLY